MDYEKKYRLALIGLIVMVVLNVGMLVSIWMIQPPSQAFGLSEDTTPPVQRFLERQLNLDRQQRQQLHQLRQQHFQQTRPIIEEMRQKRARYVEMLESADSLSQSQLDSLANQIGRLQARLEQKNYQHFHQVRSRLTPEQRRQFDNIMDQAMGRRGRGMMRGRGPGMRMRQNNGRGSE